jgi:hypothetical protein
VKNRTKRARWLLNLQQYTFQVQHRSGKNNANADALSRIDPNDNEDSSEIMETYMISVQTEENSDESEEREIQWHIFSSENSMKEDDNESYLEQELMNQFGNHLLITVGYQCPRDEMIEIYRENIKVKQVIAN